MIHEIFPHQFNNQFIITNNIGENDFILHYNGNLLLLKIIGDGFEIPRKKDVSSITNITAATFLFTLNNVSCFLIWDDLKTDDSQLIYKEINFRTFKQHEISWSSIVGLQLKNWYSENKFCGKCGSKTKEKSDERAIVCPNCNTIGFSQNISCNYCGNSM